MLRVHTHPRVRRIPTFSSYQTTDTETLNVSSPVRKHESQSWNSTCPKCLQEGMKCLIYWRLGQQTTYRKLILTWGLNRQNVNVEWKYKTDTDSKHTFGDITYHLPGTSLLSYLRAVQTAFISFGEKAASLDISNLTLVGSLIHSNFIISFSLSCVSPLGWIPLERFQDTCLKLQN